MPEDCSARCNFAPDVMPICSQTSFVTRVATAGNLRFLIFLTPPRLTRSPTAWLLLPINKIMSG